MSEIFRPYEVLINTTYGIVLKYFVKSAEDEEKLRQSSFEWRTNGTESAPFHSGGYSSMALAQKCAIRSGDGANTAPLNYQQPPLRSIWRSPEGEKEKLKSDLSAIRQVVTELAETIEGYNHLLVPYWYAKGDIEDSIRRSHGRRYDDAVVFDPDGAVARKPHFEELMELAIEWGSTKNERAELQTQMNAWAREAKKIETELKYLAKKEKKREQAKSGQPASPRLL